MLAAFGFGPAGAVLYRMAEFVARYWKHRSKTQTQPASAALQHAAARAWGVIDWLPARATALGFAVVGSFEEAIDCWRNHAQRFPDDNDGVILAATSGAINVRLGGEALRRLRPPITQGDVAFNLAKRELTAPEIGAAPGERPERDEPRGRALAVLSALDAAGAGVERRGGPALRALLVPERKAPPVVRGGPQRAAAVRP